MKRRLCLVFVISALILALAPATLARAQAPDGAVEAASTPPALVDHPLGPIPEDEPRNEAYGHGGYALFFVGQAWTMLVLLMMVTSGFGAWLQEVAESVTRRPNLKVALYVVLFTLVSFLASFPLSVYGGYVREKKYGFANQSFAAWLGDEGKGLLIGIIAQAIFLPLLYLVIRKLGHAWWIPGAVLAIAFVILVLTIFPVFVAPLFNTFEPLKDEALRKDILELAHRQGIPAGEVYQVDASRQSEHTNAYVAGILGTQRIVLYDTMLKRFAPREIRSIMGHEMGHYVLRHIWKTVGLFAILIVAGFLFVDRAGRSIIDSHTRFGIRRFEEPASLPLILLLLSVFFFVLRPIISTFSRAQEHAADRFGLEVTRDAEAAASSFLKFARHDLTELHVHPLIEFFLYTHPSAGNRIRFAQEWARAHPEASNVENFDTH